MPLRHYPAIEISFRGPADEEHVGLVLAALDDFGPTAIDEDREPLRAFFTTAAARDSALAALTGRDDVRVAPIEVSDEDWAARTQAALTPVVVGRLTIAPPWTVTPELRASAPGPVIRIQPSMGFGTGHHASTRMCLHWLQQASPAGKSVLDVGTGSGVLAIAASILGASASVGIDVDPDALTNARENLELNSKARVEFLECGLESAQTIASGPFDLVLANLTGALICRSAGAFGRFAAAYASLIVSGFQVHDLGEVSAALEVAGWTRVSHESEQTWIGALFERT